MIGYHYTSLANYQQIRRQGLIPYRLDVFSSSTNRNEIWEGLQEKGFEPIGIWLWKEDPNEKSHIGNILWHCMEKDTFEVVKLKVSYEWQDIMTNEAGETILLRHLGSLGSWIYHIGALAEVIDQPVSVENIELLGIYDMRMMGYSCAKSKRAIDRRLNRNYKE